MTAHSLRGSLWHRWDLHFHTPSSYDYHNKNVTDQELVESLISDGIRAVAVTDHHTMDVERIQNLQHLGGDNLTVFPGIELRSDQGGDPIHYICIFPEDCDLNHVWTTLQGKLGLTAASILAKGGNDVIYVPIEKGAKEARELGGVVTIHAGAKSNSIEGIKNKEQFQQRIKYDITHDWVDLMEVGQVKDIDVHLNTIFPITGLDKPLIICSDNHGISNYSVKAPLWFRADPTFRGLLMVLREPRHRVFIGERPTEQLKIEMNRTKYIRDISFQRKATAPASVQWFDGKLELNPGLVAIVGNKGSGKSALADTLGLVGSSKNSEGFSFLNNKRFKHPKAGYAQHFEATIEWISGEKITRCLADTIPPQEVERLKYLPQDHVETVCNELSGIDVGSFEQELKSVIFSHVPEVSRLGQSSLDDLVRFQTTEKQKRIDFLFKELREINRGRAHLEAQADPSHKNAIAEKIKRRKLELAAHDEAKPTEVKNPADATAASPSDPALLKDLEVAEDQKQKIESQIVDAQKAQQQAERRWAVARRLLERIDNFQKEFEVFKSALKEDMLELELEGTELATLTINRAPIEKIRDESMAIIAASKKILDENEESGLKKQLESVHANVAELQSKLDAPNRAYQIYLKDLGEWQEQRQRIEGHNEDPESLKGLETTLAALSDLPAKIEHQKAMQKKLALEIHSEKLAQMAVYRMLYEPVQKNVDSHKIAKEKMKLEFRAELANEGFANRLLALLALNRRGSFMGVEEGRTKVESFTQKASWEDPESIGEFLEDIDRALHEDQREQPHPSVQIRDQLLRDKKVEDVFDLLYGLDYLQPRYILRWEGKELSMLSPGERGTLLLVFYLLIDQSDIPLVIDQPEGNLDNHTVAKVLVDCIREARKYRQVFIVTHNPNLAVVCDADQVIHASMNKSDGNKITYTTGSLENPAISKHVTDVLEGTRWAFGIRGAKYEVGE